MRVQTANVLTATNLGHEIDGETILDDVSVTIRSGEVVGIAGGSGAGKTTLLETLALLREPTTGQVENPASFGFVPQDDIIHVDLPLGRTLEIAAELRMPRSATRAARAAAVARVLEQLDIGHRSNVKVRSLSGGQRKRASIAVELLVDPDMFFLDEPTSGLDPATSASVMGQLRGLANTGTAVVLTTHSPSDLSKCDRVIFMGHGGRVVFIGTPSEAKSHFRVTELATVYELLSGPDSVEEWLAHRDEVPSPEVPKFDSIPATSERASDSVGWFRQWKALTRRTVDLQLRNRLTLSILVGSPAGVVGMLAVLFPSGSFAAGEAGTLAAIQLLFWVTFSSFFFGVTYGLLQIVGEVEVLRRERRQGLSLSAYVMSKITVLAPLLLLVNVAMLGVLQVLSRLPSLTGQDWVLLLSAGSLISLAGVALGLLASSLVQNPAQATLALPMLCFPQVLFAGAAIPVSQMTGAGSAMSVVMANRWGFESMGRTLELARGAAASASTSGFADTFTGSASSGMWVLAGIAASMTGATIIALGRRLG